jgi:hypothetical protein
LVLAAALAWAAPAPAAAIAPGWALDWRFPDGQPPPFTRQELESAVSIRQPAVDAAGAVAVGWDDGGTGRVEASSDLRRRQVLLGDARGAEAARMVALAVVDVLRPLPEVQLAGAPAPRSVALALLGAVNRGATSAGFAFEPALRAGWPAGGRLALVGELGYGQGRGRAAGQTLVLHMIPMRLGLQVRAGGWAFGAGALVRPYRTGGLAGGAGRVAGTLYGGHLALERSLALSARLAFLAAAAVDLQANAIDLQVRGRSLLQSGRVTPMFRMGLHWGAW